MRDSVGLALIGSAYRPEVQPGIHPWLAPCPPKFPGAITDRQQRQPASSPHGRTKFNRMLARVFVAVEVFMEKGHVLQVERKFITSSRTDTAIPY